jgi:hypothetical protein
LFKSSKICEHAVSFAQYNGKIEQFHIHSRKPLWFEKDRLFQTAALVPSVAKLVMFPV